MIVIALIALFFLALPIAAIKYGVDTRSSAGSKEQELAELGLSWPENRPTYDPRPSARPAAIGLRMLMRRAPHRAARP